MSEPPKAFDERMRLIRWRMRKENLRFRDELRLIPRSAYVVLAVLYLVALVAVESAEFAMHEPIPPSDMSSALAALALVGIVTGAGMVVSAIVMLFVYVNRDAKRRGMNSTLWTLLAIFVPYFIGLILYFFLREPLPFDCPQCHATVSARYNFCPSCKFNLRPACTQCKREVRIEDRYCPHCASELAGTTA